MSVRAFEPFEVSADDAEWMQRVGRLRVSVWSDEGTLARGMFADGVWLDRFDREGRHWVACDERGELVAAGIGVECSSRGESWIPAPGPRHPVPGPKREPVAVEVATMRVTGRV